MKHNHILTALLLASALLLGSCNKQPQQVSDGTDTDSDTQTPIITEIETPAPPMPSITEGTEEVPPTEETTAPAETERTEDTEVPVPDLPTEETAPTTEEPEAQQPESPAAPPVFTKQILDITDRLIPGGAPVTGQVASVQSNHIRLLLDYSVQPMEDGTIQLTFDVGLSCYELWCSAKKDMGTITVNGVSRTFSTEAINQTESEKTYIPFLTQSYNAAGGQSASVEVSWDFNGTYGGSEVGTLITGITLQWHTADIAPPVAPDPTDIVTPDSSSEPTTETTQPADPAEPTEPVDPVETTEPAAPTEPVIPTEPVNPPEPTEPVNPPEPTEPTDESSPLPAEPGEDTTPVPDVPPTAPDVPTGPTVTGTPEETVPTDEA